MTAYKISQCPRVAAPHDASAPRQRPRAEQVRDDPDRQELHPRPQRNAQGGRGGRGGNIDDGVGLIMFSVQDNIPFKSSQDETESKSQFVHIYLLAAVMMTTIKE